MLRHQRLSRAGGRNVSLCVALPKGRRIRGGRGLLIRLIVDIREDASEFGVGRTRSIKALFFGLTFGASEFRVSGLRVVGVLFFGLTFGASVFRVSRLRVVGALLFGLTFGASEFRVSGLRVAEALLLVLIVGVRDIGVDESGRGAAYSPASCSRSWSDGGPGAASRSGAGSVSCPPSAAISSVGVRRSCSAPCTISARSCVFAMASYCHPRPSPTTPRVVAFAASAMTERQRQPMPRALAQGQ